MALRFQFHHRLMQWASKLALGHVWVNQKKQRGEARPWQKCGGDDEEEKDGEADLNKGRP